MAPPLLSINTISLSHGVDPIFDHLDMHIRGQDRLCLLGRNGTGKSTLMKIIAGQVEPDSGDIWWQPGASVAFLPQEPDAKGFETLYDYIADGLPTDEADQTYRVDVLVEDLSVNATATPDSASGGELRRAALAKTLIQEPDLLLLDEPTNHLDIHTILWLEGFLQKWRGAFILISHDRRFLEKVTSACLWLDRGVVKRLDAGFDKFDAWMDEELANEEMRRSKLDKKIAEESRWAVEGISARRKRNQGRLRRLYDMRADRAAQRKQTGSINLQTVEGGKSGSMVIEAKSIEKSYEGRTLFSDFSIRIKRGDRIGIIGPNGAGKSTLIKCLTGEIESDGGSVRIGTNLDTLYLDQRRDNLDDTMSVRDTVTGGGGNWVTIGDDKKHVMGYLKDFLFRADQADTPVGALSGGERNRLLLATYLIKPSNFLVLDEPTNDLDMDTLDLLQEVLMEYKGTILLVSHDRDFIDRIVTSTIVFDGEGGVQEYAGGYADYEETELTRYDQEAVAIHKPSTKATSQKVISIETAQSKKSKKLSYKDQRELDMLPAGIETLSMQISDLEAQLSDPELYSKSPEKFQKVNADLNRKQEELETKEMRWLELEELKDSLS
ncbi:ATP-binding cassette domain-containing protein [Temperatibacter marinus]|uniref:ATP-binding protein Uup n=1 Tax=Temperatibacter marinus TaxID=1456591 RepID=A0AA52H8W7_9PROT|nr:ATP-binding cassette domain-containing protein [Temperatibacter marinus]WND01897.1 ATP-binding cassette domain-containing protein [Temperatibacter marinus]